MSGKPRDWEIEKAVRECLKEKGSYRSLSALHADVSKKLAEKNPPIGTTPERIRKIGIEKRLFTVEISYSRSNSLSTHESCPVCGGKLTVSYNRTLDSENAAAMGAKCGRCGYDVRSGFMRPARYAIRRVRDASGRAHRDAEKGRNPAERSGRSDGRGPAHVRHGKTLRGRFRLGEKDRIVRFLCRKPQEHRKGHGIRLRRAAVLDAASHVPEKPVLNRGPETY